MSNKALKKLISDMAEVMRDGEIQYEFPRIAALLRRADIVTNSDNNPAQDNSKMIEAIRQANYHAMSPE